MFQVWWNRALYQPLSNISVKAKTANVLWDALVYTTCHIDAYGETGEKFLPTQVLLNNESDINIMKLAMLYNIRPADKPVHISGAGGIQLQADDIG